MLTVIINKTMFRVREQECHKKVGFEMGRDAPTRVIFTGQRCQKAYRLNKFLASMRYPEVREAFNCDPDLEMERFGLSDHEKDLVRRRDYQGMLDHGAVIYAISKAATGLQTNLLAVGAKMRGETPETVAAWIKAGKNVVG